MMGIVMRMELEGLAGPAVSCRAWRPRSGPGPWPLELFRPATCEI